MRAFPIWPTLIVPVLATCGGRTTDHSTKETPPAAEVATTSSGSVSIGTVGTSGATENGFANAYGGPQPYPMTVRETGEAFPQLCNGGSGGTYAGCYGYWLCNIQCSDASECPRAEGARFDPICDHNCSLPCAESADCPQQMVCYHDECRWPWRTTDRECTP